MPEALRRECLEEIGFPVAVVRSEYLRDHTAAPYESAHEPGGDAHRVELMFECRVSGRGAWSRGAALDSMQVAARWIGLDELGQCRLYAKALSSFLNECRGVSAPAYLGDVN